MIKTFANKETERIYHQEHSRKIQRTVRYIHVTSSANLENE